MSISKNEETQRKYRQYYHSLLGQQRILNRLSDDITSTELFALERELKQLNIEFPDLIEPFDKHVYYSHTKSDYRHGSVYYSRIGILSFLAIAISRLQVEIEESSDSPVIEKKEFAFVYKSKLRIIVERDFYEIQKAFISGCWKSVIILCGGVIEAILTDLLLSNETAAKSSTKAPKKTDISQWDFVDLINVVVDLKLVSVGVEKLSHPIREYRNLVHPSNEIRYDLSFGIEEAKIAQEVLNIVHRDLSNISIDKG